MFLYFVGSVTHLETVRMCYYKSCTDDIFLFCRERCLLMLSVKLTKR